MPNPERVNDKCFLIYVVCIFNNETKRPSRVRRTTKQAILSLQVCLFMREIRTEQSEFWTFLSTDGRPSTQEMMQLLHRSISLARVWKLVELRATELLLPPLPWLPPPLPLLLVVLCLCRRRPPPCRILRRFSSSSTSGSKSSNRSIRIRSDCHSGSSAEE